MKKKISKKEGISSKDKVNKKTGKYNYLISNVGQLLEQGRKQAYRAVNNIMVQTYWHIGRVIVEYEQEGQERAEYGSKLLDQLSKDLSLRYGKGFGRSNIQYMRLFFLKYQICETVSRKSSKCQTLSGKFRSNKRTISETMSRKSQKWQTLSKFLKCQTVSGRSQKCGTVSHQLTWSHYVLLLSISDDLARSFYEKQSIKENWSVRVLKRQINSMLFERIALGKNKKDILSLAKKGHIVKNQEDIIKDPYILEFLKIPEDYKISEKELEQKIIDNLQKFLLELGKGFTFVARQQRITLNNTHFYVDLVFYHRILRCFVLIDLKIGKVNHSDIGQMNMYLNYFKKEVNIEGDTKPIGIILSAEKDDIMVEYALGGISNKLFVSKYKLYLPDKAELKRRLMKFV